MTKEYRLARATLHLVQPAAPTMKRVVDLQNESSKGGEGVKLTMVVSNHLELLEIGHYYYAESSSVPAHRVNAHLVPR